MKRSKPTEVEIIGTGHGQNLAQCLAEHDQVGANVTVRAGDSKQYVITLDMTVSETADMLRWLEKRRARHG